MACHRNGAPLFLFSIRRFVHTCGSHDRACITCHIASVLLVLHQESAMISRKRNYHRPASPWLFPTLLAVAGTAWAPLAQAAPVEGRVIRCEQTGRYSTSQVEMSFRWRKPSGTPESSAIAQTNRAEICRVTQDGQIDCPASRTSNPDDAFLIYDRARSFGAEPRREADFPRYVLAA